MCELRGELNWKLLTVKVNWWMFSSTQTFNWAAPCTIRFRWIFLLSEITIELRTDVGVIDADNELVDTRNEDDAPPSRNNRRRIN